MHACFLFQVGWSSVKDYHTFVWALAPADYQEGTDVNCCVHFQGTHALLVLFYSLQFARIYIVQFLQMHIKPSVGDRHYCKLNWSVLTDIPLGLV